MSGDPRPLKSILKRGALLAAANWPVIIVQFVADALFKVLLAVPILGGVFLVALLLGGDVNDLLAGDVRHTVAAVAGALTAQPLTLAAFLFAFSVALLGGSVLLFLIKGGALTVLVTGERAAGPLEQPPLRLSSVRQAAQFSLDRFVAGSLHFFRRYLTLGLALLVMYAGSGAVYLLGLYGAYRVADSAWLLAGWTFIAALSAGVLLVWITLVNLIYLLTQIVIAVEDAGVRSALRTVRRFLRSRSREIAGIFLVVLAVVVLATGASFMASTALGLIAFVPLAGLAVLPLQVAAWLLRGFVFQYLGLTAAASYLTVYRVFRQQEAGMRMGPSGAAPVRSAPRTRIA
jgi:hypothetical protein